MLDMALNTGGHLVSPLRGLKSGSSSAGRAASLAAAEYPDLGYLVIRGTAGDAAFMSAAEGVLGAPLPVRPRSVVSCRAGVVLWQSPDEWWLVCARGDLARLAGEMTLALQGCFSQVVDNSGGFTAVHIGGKDCNIVLRHLTPYDIDGLEVHDCVSLAIGKATMTAIRASGSGLTLVFRRSFAPYIWQLIDRAALPYGMKVVSPVEAHDGLLAALLGAKDQESAANGADCGLA